LVFAANGQRLPTISKLRGKPFPNDHLDLFFNAVVDAAIALATFIRAVMRTRMPALASIALLGFCIQANAQAPCQELTRLRSEAQEALKQSMTAPASERCYMYIRLSVAWGAVAQYANDNRESCHISIPSLNEFEQYHRKAVKDRANVCAG